MSCPVEDPYYETEVAQWVLKRVRGTGIRVDVLDALDVPACSSRTEQHIWVRAGLTFPLFHWSMARGIVHQLFGVEPEHAPAVASPDARRVGRHAQVIPLQRPGFSSGSWRP